MNPRDLLGGILLWLMAVVPITLVVAWLRSRRRVRELEARLRETEIATDPRVDALARNVDALAEQMEQLASGQEFLNRLVSTQRGHLSTASASPPVVTPH
jgi:hypothetical protein